MSRRSGIQGTVLLGSVLVSGLSLVSCASHGSLGDPGTGTGGIPHASGSAPDPSATNQAVSCDTVNPGPSPLRRLTNFEYRNSLEDLLGDVNLVASVTKDLVLEPTSPFGFRSSAEMLTITPLLADSYTSIALQLGKKVPDVPGVVPCRLEQVDGVCAQQFVESFGKRVFRRPLERSELTNYSKLYNQVVEQQGSFRKALELVSAALLSSPHFLHRVELAVAAPGEVPGTRAVQGYEMASRLSFLLWQTMPDAALLEAAEKGELASHDGVLRSVERMLNDPKAYRVYEFFEQWLNLDELPGVSRNTSAYPSYSPALKQLWAAESRAFVADLLTSGGTLSDLFAAPYTFANRALAEHYQFAKLPSSERFERVDDKQRSGVLTQPGLWIHDHEKTTSMVRRGQRLRIDFLCETVPNPPPNVNVTLPEVDASLGQKQKLEQHRVDPSCAVCHERLDPAGAIFDQFDAVGRFRTKDETGGSVEVGGDLRFSRDLDGHYGSVRELGLRMAESETVRKCVTLQAFRFFYGRDVTPADQCSMQQIAQRFAANNYRLSDLIFALTRSDQFLFRDTEVAQ